MAERRLLFVCTRNRLRSPTAEEVLGRLDGVTAISAGTNRDAPTTVSGDLLEWADVVLVMERRHASILKRRFGRQLDGVDVVVLGIPDRYEFMDPELVELLEARCARHVAGGAA